MAHTFEAREARLDDFEAREARLGDVFAKTAGAVRRLGRGRWALSLANGVRLRVAARLDEVWCDMSAMAPAGGRTRLAPKDLWDVLACNRLLPAGVRAVVPPGRRRLRLDAEVPIEDEGIPESLICSRLGGFLEAARQVRSGPQGGLEADAIAVASDAIAVEADEIAVKAFADAITAAGWEVLHGGGKRLSVKLDAPGKALFALAGFGALGEARLAAELDFAESASPQPAARPALALLMLTAAAAVRLVRPYRTAGEAPSVGFEVAGAEAPSAAWCGDALCALSLAARACAAEARALQDDRIAKEYLAARGWA